jgi:hypothetical protein
VLTVLGGKALVPPGGAPPWDASGPAAAAGRLAYDQKAMAAGGGACQADDAEAESGGPGRRVSVSPWGDLVGGRYGGGEFVRQPLVDWQAFAALDVALPAEAAEAGPPRGHSPARSGLVADGSAASGTVDLAAVLKVRKKQQS